MKYPGELYTPSVREYISPEPPEYPYHDKTILVTRCGRICLEGRKINLSTVFAGQFVGVREVADKIWLVSFMDHDLGFFDEESKKVDPAENPFVAKLLPMSSV
jgi:putative transposase